ncbi:MAG: radical SAM protein, partial [Spirochaetales bacterium]
MTVNCDRPLALLVVPPVYDFALFDLFLKPYGLLRLGRWLAEAGWEVRLINGLDYRDSETASLLGWPKRRAEGTGKFFRQPAQTLDVLKPLLESRRRRGEWNKPFARYGVLPEVLRRQIRFNSNIRREDHLLLPSSPMGMPGDKSSLHSLETPEVYRHPDLILITTGMTYWYKGVEEVVAMCREEHPTALLCVGGIYVTLLPDHCRKITGADLVLQEDNMEPLKRALEQRGLPVPLCPVPTFPLPLKEIWADAGVIRLNRGCPLSCDYCASKALYPRFQMGTAEEGFLAFRELWELCGTRSFAFYDDALLYRKEEVFLPFLEKVIRYLEGRRIRGEEATLLKPRGIIPMLQGKEKGKGIPSVSKARFYLPNGVHLQALDKNTLQLMRRAGVQEIRLGFESASPEFHKKYDRKTNATQMRDAVETIKEGGYREEDVSVYLLAGLPDQEATEVEASI